MLFFKALMMPRGIMGLKCFGENNEQLDSEEISSLSIWKSNFYISISLLCLMGSKILMTFLLNR